METEDTDASKILGTPLSQVTGYLAGTSRREYIIIQNCMCDSAIGVFVLLTPASELAVRLANAAFRQHPAQG